MPISKTIETETDIKAGLTTLIALDPRLAVIADISGDLPLRRQAPGFNGLARIIIAQQVSKQSAEAIAGRFNAYIPNASPKAYLAADDTTLRAIGLSRPKQRTLYAVAEAITSGQLNLEECARSSAIDAIAHMSAVKGIGPWTAEVYLLFCAGHRDVFPAGDLALQIAVHEAFELKNRPNDKQLRSIAQLWSPWRGVAARLFWAWYEKTRNRAMMA